MATKDPMAETRRLMAVARTKMQLQQQQQQGSQPAKAVPKGWTPSSSSTSWAPSAPSNPAVPKQGGRLRLDLWANNKRNPGGSAWYPDKRQKKSSEEVQQEIVKKYALPPGLVTGPQDRTSLGEEYYTGEIKSFNGVSGWITPFDLVEHEHPEYKGDIFLHRGCMVAGHSPVTGAQVRFTLYSDAKGIGAENCEVTTLRSVLHRERVTTELTTGSIAEWSANKGWIDPHEQDASWNMMLQKHKKQEGRLRFEVEDLVGIQEPRVGDLVEFHVYVDLQGIGAEEVHPF